jgi:chromosome segregation protein
MRLEKIKLVGFKSFVDPTTVYFPSSLTGVVGPNGCGKSNVIDAVRWVMGESSAKQLRGESSIDVIFNGTVDRKPVGIASVELTFDNRDGRVGGEYAKYAQLAIKRQVNREAKSQYYLNGTRCRRRDIIDVFLGTGLGARSYSIIEQGMISRLIESKPEELRGHLEEVSGISKYKERRRETENRIRHTRENLARVFDLREEIDKQLKHLKRQARAAERYKEYKTQERLLKARQQAMQWQALEQELQQVREQLTKKETALQGLLASYQHTETALVTYREQQHGLLETRNNVQKRYYNLGSEISRIEQSMQHFKERREQLVLDFDQARENQHQIETHMQQDTQHEQERSAELAILKPQIDGVKTDEQQAQAALQEAETQMSTWQQSWDGFNQTAAATAQIAEVEQTRIREIEHRQLSAQKRLEALEIERKDLDVSVAENQWQALQQQQTDLAANHDTLKTHYAQSSEKIVALREQETARKDVLDQLKSSLQTAQGKFASLDALQKEALGQKEAHASNWLAAQSLEDKPRLAQILQVEPGWERAVEIVLGHFLEAVCVERAIDYAQALTQLEKGHLVLLDQTSQAIDVDENTLAAKIQSPASLKALLMNVRVADNLEQALSQVAQLSDGQSLITQEGSWLGQHWVRAVCDQDVQAGVLARERELKALSQTIDNDTKQAQAVQESLVGITQQLTEQEEEREKHQRVLSQSQDQLSDLKVKMEVKRTRVEQINRRIDQLTKESNELREQYNTAHDALGLARHEWQGAMQKMEQDANARESLLTARDASREQLSQAKESAQNKRHKLHELDVKANALQTQIHALKQSVERMQSQQTMMKTRCEKLQDDLSEGDTPLHSMQQALEEQLKQRAQIEGELTQAKQALDENEHQIRELEQKRQEEEAQVQSSRQAIESYRLSSQESLVRQKTLQERLAEDNLDAQTVLAELPDDAEQDQINEELELTTRRIERLGPINLAAIDEFETQSERKVYLDSQYNDLEQALATLESAIRKIDKETRQRFQESFDIVNQNFQKYFPKIFGGGSAYLELTGDDLLSTGVSVMARPPGKRNTTIHLLSGGEKALTAIALVFSLFQVNPAPFCMLDEVDAPLDDMNVNRYCNLVKEMSSQVQFIFISHNKVAIEMGDHLVGVTMNEPGVSRIVSVDVEKAVSMAEA